MTGILFGPDFWLIKGDMRIKRDLSLVLRQNWANEKVAIWKSEIGMSS